MDLLELRGSGLLSGFGALGVYEPPSAGNFSAVQFRNNTGGPRSAVAFVDPYVYVDVDCTVRIVAHTTALASLDGLMTATDPLQGTGALGAIQARSESPAAAPSVGFGALVRLPAGGATIRGVWRFYNQGAWVFVPEVTGVGIGAFASFVQSLEGFS